MAKSKLEELSITVDRSKFGSSYQLKDRRWTLVSYKCLICEKTMRNEPNLVKHIQENNCKPKPKKREEDDAS